MGNLRWGIICSGVALIVSVGLGIFSGVNGLHIFLRAIVFMILFFGIGFALRFIVNTFFPELLFLNDDGTEQADVFAQAQAMPGSRVNITLDATGEYAVPELYKTPDDPEELGNIEDLISGSFMSRSEDSGFNGRGIDRKPQEGYNGMGSFQGTSDQDISFDDIDAFEKPVSEKTKAPVFTPSLGDESGGLGGLPDLDALAMAFGAGGGEDTFVPMSVGVSSAPAAAQFEDEELEPDRSQYKGNKPQPLEGDFNPKELAEGIRTVLSKEK